MTRMLAVGVLCLLGGISLCASGQNAPAPPAAPPVPAAPAPAPAPAAAPAAPTAPVPAAPAPATPAASQPKGDVITLKSGREIKGVQIVGKTPSEIRVQVTPEVVFSIPKSQVDKIEEDGFDPRTGQSSAPAGEAPKGSMISGEKLSPEVFENLSKPLPEPAPKYDNKDLVEVLAELSQKTGVPMVVDGSVMELPAKEREWTVAAKPGTTLMGLLQEELLRKFKKLAVVYQFDKLLIVTKEKANAPAAAAKPAEEAAAAKPAEAPAAAPATLGAAPAPASPGAAPAAPAQPAAEAATAPASSGAQPASSAPRQRRRAGAPAN